MVTVTSSIYNAQSISRWQHFNNQHFQCATCYIQRVLNMPPPMCAVSTIALACSACQCAQSAAIPCAQSALSHVCTIPCALSDTKYHTCVSNTIPCALSALSHSHVQHANAKVHPIPRQPRAQLNLHLLSRSTTCHV